MVLHRFVMEASSPDSGSGDRSGPMTLTKTSSGVDRPQGDPDRRLRHTPCIDRACAEEPGEPLHPAAERLDERLVRGVALVLEPQPEDGERRCRSLETAVEPRYQSIAPQDREGVVPESALERGR